MFRSSAAERSGHTRRRWKAGAWRRAFELLGAAGLVRRATRAWAAWGLFALTIAVTPANVYMLQQAGEFPGIPVWMLVARLPLQIALLAVLAWVGLRSSNSRRR
jgi:uncharacterized membrane protein